MKNVVGPQGAANNEIDEDTTESVKNRVTFWMVDIGSNVQMEIVF